MEFLWTYNKIIETRTLRKKISDVIGEEVKGRLKYWAQIHLV